MNSELVSVCIPVYNGEHYIAETLTSLVNQTYENIEIIVSDNASTDNTVEIVKNIIKTDDRIKLNINSKNLGYSGNLNVLIDLASSDFIAIYHADDIYDKTIIEKQLTILKENPSLGGCFTSAQHISKDGNPINNNYNIDSCFSSEIISLKSFLLKFLEIGGSPLYCPSSMVKKNIYIELKKYNNIKYIEDLDMWIRILEKYNLAVIKEKLLFYRIHEKQGSSYYVKPTRIDRNVGLVYIEKYIIRNNLLDYNIQHLLAKNCEKDFFSIALNGIKTNTYDVFTKNLENASSYIPRRNPKYWLFKILKFRINFNFLRFVLYVKKIINKGDL